MEDPRTNRSGTDRRDTRPYTPLRVYLVSTVVGDLVPHLSRRPLRPENRLHATVTAPGRLHRDFGPVTDSPVTTFRTTLTSSVSRHPPRPPPPVPSSWGPSSDRPDQGTRTHRDQRFGGHDGSRWRTRGSWSERSRDLTFFTVGGIPHLDSESWVSHKGRIRRPRVGLGGDRLFGMGPYTKVGTRH